MKTLIVFDSVFGNTERLAIAIGASLGAGEQVETIRAGDFRPEKLRGVELLIAGSPTRAFRPTKAISGLLKALPADSLKGVKVAAFDTRISTAEVKSRLLNVMVKLFGYAAKPIADALVKKGGRLMLAPEGFFVQGSEGPLFPGELERAAAWAGTLRAP